MKSIITLQNNIASLLTKTTRKKQYYHVTKNVIRHNTILQFIKQRCIIIKKYTKTQNNIVTSKTTINITKNSIVILQNITIHETKL